jgi:hypothetical protein
MTPAKFSRLIKDAVKRGLFVWATLFAMLGFERMRGMAETIARLVEVA